MLPADRLAQRSAAVPTLAVVERHGVERRAQLVLAHLLHVSLARRAPSAGSESEAPAALLEDALGEHGDGANGDVLPLEPEDRKASSPRFVRVCSNRMKKDPQQKKVRRGRELR